MNNFNSRTLPITYYSRRKITPLVMIFFILLTTLLPLGTTLFAQSSLVSVALMEISGKRGKKTTKKIYNLLEKQEHCMMFDNKWMLQRAAQMGYHDPKFYLEPILLLEVASQSHIDVVIYGDITKTGKRRFLELNVFDTNIGKITGQVSVELNKKGKLSTKKAKEVEKKLLAHIASAEERKKLPPPVIEPEPVPVVEPDPVPVVEPDPPPVIIEEDTLGVSRYLAIFSAGGLINARNYSLTDENKGFDHSTAHPGIGINLKALPLTRIGTGWFTEFGIDLEFKLGFVSTTINEKYQEPREVDSSHYEFDAGLFYRFHLGDLTEGVYIDFGVGIHQLTYKIEDEQMYEVSSKYQGLSISLDIMIPLVPSFRVEGSFRVIPLLATGEASFAYGKDKSSFGIGFGLGLSYDLFGGGDDRRDAHFLDRLYVTLQYSGEYLSAEYAGTATNTMVQNPTSSDWFHHVFIALGYRFE